MMLLSQARLCIADIGGSHKQLRYFCVHCKSSEIALKLKNIVIDLFNAYIYTYLKQRNLQTLHHAIQIRHSTKSHCLCTFIIDCDRTK